MCVLLLNKEPSNIFIMSSELEKRKMLLLSNLILEDLENNMMTFEGITEKYMSSFPGHLIHQTFKGLIGAELISLRANCNYKITPVGVQRLKIDRAFMQY